MNKLNASIIAFVTLAAGFFCVDQLKTADFVQSQVVKREQSLRKADADRIHKRSLELLAAYRAEKKSEPTKQQVVEMWTQAKTEVNK